MDEAESLLAAAEDISSILRRHQVDAVVIGALAMAAHHYIRYTEDLDLGVNAGLASLRKLVDAIREAGYTAELREPDLDDPLGGVIDVSGAFGLLKIISFAERFPAVIDDALRESTMVVREGSPLRLVPLPHLIVLKLYAGGLKSKADIIELLARNEGVDRNKIRELCEKYRLRGFDELLEQLED